MTIQAPYRFVPLSSLVILPDWAEKVSHDKPFKDGICGELEIEITTHGELCVGGQQTPANPNEAGRVHFYRTPDNQLAIPASSLKGMLRNVVEIATFSRFTQVEDKKLGVRDISDSNNFYCKTIVSQPVNAGWLKFENNHWVIYPCSFARVHQKDIIDYFTHINHDDWICLKTAQARYNRLGVCPLVNYEDSGEKKYNKILAKLKNMGELSGHLIMTGQPGAVYTQRNAKKYEFIFFNQTAENIKISVEVMSGFKQIHEDTAEWKYWLQHLSDLEQGIPVFFHKENNQVSSLGLAMMYKLAYKNSIHDAINQNIQSHQPDFSDLVFGHLGEGSQQGLRGRVNIGQGILQTIDNETSFTIPTVLSSPRATYYPAYIRQDNSKQFNQLMTTKRPQLSGWKRYPIKNASLSQLTGLTANNLNVQVRLETVPADTQFKTKIRLHNLRPVELGALLWSIDFGGNKACMHGLGMGKPYGFGAISLVVKQSTLRRNDAEKILDSDIFLTACRLEFEAYMEQVFTITQTSTTWKNSGNIKALLEYAERHRNIDDLAYLPEPRNFAQLKHRDNLEEFIQTFHAHQPVNGKFDITKNQYISQISTQIKSAEEQIQALKDKQERDAKKRTASDEDRKLIELEEFVKQAEEQVNGAEKKVTSTIKSKANKMFKEPFDDMWHYFSEEQKANFKALATQAEQLINDNSLSKTVKKINVAA